MSTGDIINLLRRGSILTSYTWSTIATLSAALCWDLLLGDPPNRIHPVCLVGRGVSSLWKIRPTSRGALLFWGFLLVLTVTLPMMGAGYFVGTLPPLIALPLSVFLLKASFSIKGLFSAGREIETALLDKDLEKARELTSWHLVSRDTSQLTESEITGCVIESLAENLTDSVVSPLFWYGILGLPGAWLSRSINTCDAMIGYRKGDYEWGGKFAARLDDVVQWIPARITTLMLLITLPFCRLSLSRGWSAVRTESRLTESPNAGLTMSAVAGALGVELAKRDCYTLNRGMRPCEVTDLKTLFSLLRGATILSTLFTGLTIGALLWVT